jgi:hypothetical protein
LFDTSSSVNQGTANCIREIWALTMSQDDSRRLEMHAVANKDPRAAATISENRLKEKSTDLNVEHPRNAKNSSHIDL